MLTPKILRAPFMTPPSKARGQRPRGSSHTLFQSPTVPDLRPLLRRWQPAVSFTAGACNAHFHFFHRAGCVPDSTPAPAAAAAIAFCHIRARLPSIIFIGPSSSVGRDFPEIARNGRDDSALLRRISQNFRIRNDVMRMPVPPRPAHVIAHFIQHRRRGQPFRDTPEAAGAPTAIR